MLRRVLASAALVTLVLLAGCSASQDVDDEAEPLSLDAYLAEIWGDRDPDDPDPTRAQAEELVAACMAEAGFEYEPMVEVPSYVQIVPSLPVTVDVAREFGYGWSIEAGGPGTGTMAWQAAPKETAAERANREYVESLSPAARAQYQSALMGDSTIVDEADAETVERGCTGRSYDEVAQADTPPVFTEVRDELDQVFWLVEEDPRVIDAQRPWGSCMAGAGYPGLVEFGDAQTLVQSMVSRFMSDNVARIDRTAAETDYDAIKASVPEELAALQAEEIAVALADANCREDSGYNRTYQDVTDEYETAFVEKYRDELEAWAAAVRQPDQ